MDGLLGGAAAALALAGGLFAAGAASAGYEGVWYGLGDDGLSGKVKEDHYTLLPDGRAFRGAPSEGLGAPVNMAHECRYAECGRFEARGASLIFSNQAAGTSTLMTVDAQGVLRKSGSKTSYRRMHLLDGPLDGTWGVFDPDGGPAVVSLTLGPDGRFREAGLLRYTAWAALAPEGQDRGRYAVERGQGAYSVSRGTLELRYDSGTVARFFIATPPAVSPGVSPTVLHLGGGRLDRASD